jgi:hypothetical protein
MNAPRFVGPARKSSYVGSFLPPLSVHFGGPKMDEKGLADSLKLLPPSGQGAENGLRPVLAPQPVDYFLPPVGALKFIELARLRRAQTR